LTNLAYFISAYKNPQAIIRLINVLANDDDKFCIHFDKNIGEQKFRLWKEQIEQKSTTKNVKIFSEFKIRWGSFDIVDATFGAMKYFEDFNYNYFINLTGECYPIKSTQQIKELLKNKNVGFMTFWKLPYEGWIEGGWYRINYNYFFLPKRTYPFVRKIKLPRLRKKLPYNLEAYGGWSLCCLPKDFVSYIVNFNEKNPKFKSFFKRTSNPSELVFQTIILNSPLKDRVVNDNKRYQVFKEAHPRILTKEDYPILKQSQKLFARKFNSKVDEEILTMIDRDILAKKD